MPTAPRLLLSVKLYVAAMLALSIAFARSFDYPYWTMMTVYILALDSSGAMRQKWLYMLSGTVAGALLGVFASFCLATSQLAIVFVLASLIAMAAFFASRDRLPSFYGFMIGGVTCLLVALPGLTTPDAAIMRALARIQDIAVGACCLFLVDSLIAPSGTINSLRRVLDDWVQQVRVLTVSALRAQSIVPTQQTQSMAQTGSVGQVLSEDERASQADHDKKVAAAEAAVMGKAAQIDTLASYLPFDPTGFGTRRRRSADAIRTRGLRLLPLIGVLSDNDAHCQRFALPLSDMPLRAALADWIDAGAPATDAAPLHRQLRGEPAHTGNGWRDMLARSQRRCLRAVFSSWQLIAAAHRNVLSPTPAAQPLAAGSRPTPTTLAHVDIGFALRVPLAVLLHLGTFASLWAAFGWVSAYAAFGMLLSSVFLIASSRAAAPTAVLFKISRIVGIALLIVGIYVTAVLPWTSTIVTVAMVLFPALLVLGAIVPVPGNVLFAVLPMAMLRLGNNGPSVNLPSLINSAAGLAVGLLSALVWVMLILRLPKGGALRRLCRENHADLYDVVRGETTDGRAYAWRALDRFLVIVPQAPDADARRALATRALREWRIGVDIAALHHRPAEQTLLSETLHRQLMKKFADDVELTGAHDDAALRETIDALLRGSVHWPVRMRCALTDLRLAIFPDAPPPSLPPVVDGAGSGGSNDVTSPSSPTSPSSGESPR